MGRESKYFVLELGSLRAIGRWAAACAEGCCRYLGNAWHWNHHFVFAETGAVPSFGTGFQCAGETLGAPGNASGKAFRRFAWAERQLHSFFGTHFAVFPAGPCHEGSCRPKKRQPQSSRRRP